MEGGGAYVGRKPFLLECLSIVLYDSKYYSKSAYLFQVYSVSCWLNVDAILFFFHAR